MTLKRIAIFASGTGSNAMNLIRHFAHHDEIQVAFVLSNNDKAPILKSAQDAGIKTIYHTNKEVSDGQFLVSLCEAHQIDWIVLAGYLRLIPTELIEAYENRMINLHPSLLPKYGGKGMYGHYVHEAVIAKGERESGITIHYVNQEFDKGEIIAQFTCSIEKNDGISELATRIHELEQRHLPAVVEKAILSSKSTL